VAGTIFLSNSPTCHQTPQLNMSQNKIEKFIPKIILSVIGIEEQTKKEKYFCISKEFL
jgi:hypothetical protein